MAKTAFSGPLIVFAASPASGVPDYNPDVAPSLFSGGVGLLDPRGAYTYQPGGADNASATGFLTASRIAVLDAAPSPLAAANIAPAQVAANGTPLVLVAVSGAGVTVGATANQATGVNTAATALALDGVPNRIAQGSTGAVAMWDPSSLLARNVRVTSVGNDSAASFLVAGLDAYGFPMSESIPGANAGVASGRKAFKFVLSVTPLGAVSGSNVSVGTGDVYGFPMLASAFPYVDIYWNGALITSAAGFLGPDATSPATSATGDVRGTFAVPSASDGIKRLLVFLTPSVGNVSSIAGLFGQAQS